MVLLAHVMLCMTELDFLKKNIFTPEMGKMCQKLGLLNLLENLVILFLNLVSNENLYYLLYSRLNPIVGKNLVPEIWAKILSSSQIAGFSNQLYL